jgi:hypothetical protein
LTGPAGARRAASLPEGDEGRRERHGPDKKKVKGTESPAGLLLQLQNG